MDLIALAVPFFLVALIIELFADRIKKTGYYRSNDAINSISSCNFGRIFCIAGGYIQAWPNVREVY